MTKEPVTISFVATIDLKALLQQWAAAEDRSVSYVMRQILVQEAQRRQTQPQAGNRPAGQSKRRRNNEI